MFLLKDTTQWRRWGSNHQPLRLVKHSTIGLPYYFESDMDQEPQPMDQEPQPMLNQIFHDSSWAGIFEFTLLETSNKLAWTRLIYLATIFSAQPHEFGTNPTKVFFYI